MPKNTELLPLLDPALTLAALARESSEPSQPAKKIRVVIAATFVAQPLASALQLYSRAFGLNADVTFFDFNQVPQALLSPDSPMRKNCEGINVILVRPEDLPGKAVAEQYLAAIKNFATTCGWSLLVSDLPPVLFEDKSEAALPAFWRQELATIPSVQILNFAEIIEELGKAASRDVEMEREASTPFSPAVYQRLGIAIARTLRKSALPSKKVLALDCDNTLWGGVVGEDGRDGIQLGDDTAGRGVVALQSKILTLKKRGILLALVSKNISDDVWDVIENHPQMLLRLSRISPPRELIGSPNPKICALWPRN